MRRLRSAARNKLRARSHYCNRRAVGSSLAMPRPARDPYQVLGVPRNASAEEIQQAFRALARETHPDVSARADAAARFHELTAAYEVLGDPAERDRYDRTKTYELRGLLRGEVIAFGPIVIRLSAVFRWLS